MRGLAVLDWLFVALLGVRLLAALAPRALGEGARRGLTLAALGAGGLQLALDGPRLQLLPAYAVALVLLAGLLWRLVRSARPSSAVSWTATLARWTGVACGLAVLLASAALCRIFPRFELPEPSGPYAIGTEELRIVDDARLEEYTPEPDDHRELLVRISYPVDAGTGSELPRDTVRSTAAVALVGALTLWRPELADEVPLSWGPTPTHAQRGAAVATAPARHPVLIFSHGLASVPGQNTALVEELASHGYVVMAIHHAALSVDFERADGALVGMAKLLGKMNAASSSRDPRVQDVFVQVREAASAETRRALLREQAALQPELTRVIAEANTLAMQDQRFLLGQLERLQASDPILAGHLDLERVGVFGMSLGGIASNLTCALDRRCRAGLNMDGFHAVLLDAPPLEVPFMHMAAEEHPHHDVVHEQALAPSYLVRVQGTMHLSFTDLGLSVPMLTRGTTLGSVAPERMARLMRDYVRAFFDRSLRGTREPLLDSPSEAYPEVTLLTRNAPARE